MDAEQAPDAPSPLADGTDIALEELRDVLAGAGALELDDRLDLLQRAEATIARSLEGLDGL